MDAAEMGTRIAALRKYKGWTQKQLAEQLHVTDKAVSKWERGVNYPDLSLLEPLAGELGITVTELLGVAEKTSEEVIQAVQSISSQERADLIREFFWRGWLNILLGFILMGTQIMASYIFAQYDLYGLPQVLTGGMLGWTGLMVGNTIYGLLNYRKLK